MGKSEVKSKKKIVKVVGAIVASAAIAASALVGGIGLAREQAKIDKYVDDKDGYQLASALVEDLNENMQNEGLDYEFENPQYRGMIAHRKNTAVDKESEKKPVEVFIVAQKEDKPYMIKASINNDDLAVTGKADAMLGTYNPHIVKYNIIENIDSLDVTYDVTPTTLETLKTLDEMGKYSSALNTPEYDGRYVKDSVIAGYSTSKNDDGSLTVTVTSNIHAISASNGLLGGEDHYYHNQETSFKITVAQGESVEEKIFDYIAKINLHKDDLKVKYSRAGISHHYQGNEKAYELKNTTNAAQKASEAQEEGAEMQQ